jgi:hypothetical protein
MVDFKSAASLSFLHHHLTSLSFQMKDIQARMLCESSLLTFQMKVSLLFNQLEYISLF